MQQKSATHSATVFTVAKTKRFAKPLVTRRILWLSRRRDSRRESHKILPTTAAGAGVRPFLCRDDFWQAQESLFLRLPAGPPHPQPPSWHCAASPTSLSPFWVSRCFVFLLGALRFRGLRPVVLVVPAAARRLLQFLANRSNRATAPGASSSVSAGCSSGVVAGCRLVS
jgi:hypothetical protein